MNLTSQPSLELIKAADRLEARYYGEDHIAGWQKSWAWQQAFPWMSSYMEENGEILAMLDLFPVHWGFYRRLLAGETDTDSILDAEIVDLRAAAPGAYPMLLMTVIVAEEIRGQGVLQRLFSDRISCYREFETRGFSFPVVATENFTGEGCGFSEKRGFAQRTHNSAGGTVYEMPWNAFCACWAPRL